MTDWLEYHEEPVTLHSGGKSHWLVRGDLIFDSPLRDVVLDWWIERVGAHSPASHVIGVPRGGMPWAKALAERLGLTWGTDDDAPYPPAPPFWVVDDVVTSGQSILAIPDAAWRLAVVDRGCIESRGRLLAWTAMPLPLLEP